AGVAEHDALVAGAAGVHALGDVGGLAADAVEDGAGRGVERVLGAGVADVLDPAAHPLVDRQQGPGRDLAADAHQAAADEGLAGHAARRVDRQDGVEHGVGDLVADLVGMAFGHGLRIEEVLALALHLSVPSADELWAARAAVVRGGNYTYFPSG